MLLDRRELGVEIKALSSIGQSDLSPDILTNKLIPWPSNRTIAPDSGGTGKESCRGVNGSVQTSPVPIAVDAAESTTVTAVIATVRI